MRTAGWTDSVSVLDRVTAVLDAFDDDESLGVSEIARRANLPKSTVSRIVADLVRQRYLDRDGALINLGLRLFELGQAVERPRRLRHLAHPTMLQVRNLTGASVRLAVRDGDDAVVIAALPGRDAQVAATRAIARAPLATTALGRAMLAHAFDAGELLAPWLPRDLGEIRRTGIATDLDAATGTACVASPILTPGRPPTAAIAVCGEVESVDPRRLGDLVLAAAVSLGRTLTG